MWFLNGSGMRGWGGFGGLGNCGLIISNISNIQYYAAVIPPASSQLPFLVLASGNILSFRADTGPNTVFTRELEIRLAKVIYLLIHLIIL